MFLNVNKIILFIIINALISCDSEKQSQTDTAHLNNNDSFIQHKRNSDPVKQVSINNETTKQVVTKRFVETPPIVKNAMDKKMEDISLLYFFHEIDLSTFQDSKNEHFFEQKKGLKLSLDDMNNTLIHYESSSIKIDKNLLNVDSKNWSPSFDEDCQAKLTEYKTKNIITHKPYLISVLLGNDADCWGELPRYTTVKDYLIYSFNKEVDNNQDERVSIDWDLSNILINRENPFISATLNVKY